MNRGYRHPGNADQLLHNDLRVGQYSLKLGHAVGGEETIHKVLRQGVWAERLATVSHFPASLRGAAGATPPSFRPSRGVSKLARRSDSAGNLAGLAAGVNAVGSGRRRGPSVRRA